MLVVSNCLCGTPISTKRRWWCSERSSHESLFFRLQNSCKTNTHKSLIQVTDVITPINAVTTLLTMGDVAIKPSISCLFLPGNSCHRSFGTCLPTWSSTIALTLGCFGCLFDETAGGFRWWYQGWDAKADRKRLLDGGFKDVYFYPCLGKWCHLTNTFQVSWNQQLETSFPNEEMKNLHLLIGGRLTAIGEWGIDFCPWMMDKDKTLASKKNTSNFPILLMVQKSQTTTWDVKKKS